MSLNGNGQRLDLVSLAADIVSAYVANNSLAHTELPSLIASVHAALTSLGRPTAHEPERPAPIVPIKRTVTPDYLISLEDGKQYKTLGRHLRGRGLTPEQYRQKWGLPADYPMTAPNYSKERAALARQTGLGQARKGWKGPRKGGAK